MTTIRQLQLEGGVLTEWAMICVLPENGLRLDEGPLHGLLAIAGEKLERKITHNGAILPERQNAIWVRGGRWDTPEAKLALDEAFKHPVLKRFVREIRGREKKP